MADPPPDLAGSRLGRFRIKRLIGKGGMGEVYAALDDSLDREVAIKVLGKAVNVEPHRRRFLREARLAARLNHPNIASIHEVGDSDGRLYIVMELLEGQSLRSILTVRRLNETDTLLVARDVARALARAHAGDVIHRDIKPENIFITHPSPDVMMAKVLDFGLARDELSRKRNDQESTATDLTGPGEACGTAGYLAPEQARGLVVDVRADVFSFGAVVYEMLTGKRAFDGRNQLSRMLAVVKNEPAPIRSIVPEIDLDPTFEAVITKCLKKSPEDRFADGAALSAALEQVARTTSQRLLAAVDLSSRNLESVPSEAGGVGASSSGALPPSPPSSSPSFSSSSSSSASSSSSRSKISTVTPAPSIRSEPPRRRPRSSSALPMERPIWPFLLAGIFVLIGLTLIVITVVTRPPAPSSSSQSSASRALATNSTGARGFATPDDPSPAVGNAPPGASPSPSSSSASASPSPDALSDPSSTSTSSSSSSKSTHHGGGTNAAPRPGAAFTKLPSFAPTVASSTAPLATPPPAASPAPTPAPTPTAEPSKVGTVRLQQGQDGVMTVIVDGEYRRVRGNTITLPCGRHKIRVGFKDERFIEVPCGGTISL